MQLVSHAVYHLILKDKGCRMRSADKTRFEDHMEAGRMAQQIKALAVQPGFGSPNPHKG